MNAENSKESNLEIIVKAEKLFNKKNSIDSENTMDECTDLITNHGTDSPYGNKNKDQTTNVTEGSQMVWSISLSGEKGDKDYTVILDSIKQGDSGFFTKIAKVNDTTIVGDVTINKNFKGKVEPYTILFHIAKKGTSEDSNVLTIDPRIRINQ